MRDAMQHSTVNEWAAGRWTARIICDRGHKRRLIDRIAVDELGDGDLYRAWHPEAAEEGPAADFDWTGNPDGGAQHSFHKYVLTCPSCTLTVRLNERSLRVLAGGLSELGGDTYALESLGAIVSKQ